MNLVLVDRTGRVRCALWDRHADTASRSGNLQGKIIRIGHAYTRQGLAGDAEVNAGDRSSIEFDPPDIPHFDFPEFEELFIPVGKITPETNQVNAVGIVQGDARHYSFAKEDRLGSVLRTVIADESGSITVVAWNERAEELREIKKGDILQIVNARTRLDTNARPELHVEARSQAAILATPPKYLRMPVPRIYKIADLTAQIGSADLSLSVLARSAPREVKRSTGGSVNVSSLLVADETGIASLSLWDDKAELVNQLTEGDSIRVDGVSVRERLGELRLGLGRSGELQKSAVEIVAPTGGGGSAKVTLWRDQAIGATKLRPGTRLRLTGLRVRPGLSGQLELSSIPLTKIETVDKAATDRPAWEDIRQVISLEAGLTTWIKGLVLDVVDRPKLAVSCEACGEPLTVSDGNFVCEHCKSNKAGKITLNGRLKIDDGTGVTSVILADQNPRQFTPIDTQEFRERMLKEGKVALELGREVLSNLVGKEIEAYGTVESGGGEEKLIFKAKRIVTLDKL